MRGAAVQGKTGPGAAGAPVEGSEEEKARAATDIQVQPTTHPPTSAHTARTHRRHHHRRVFFVDFAFEETSSLLRRTSQSSEYKRSSAGIRRERRKREAPRPRGRRGTCAWQLAHGLSALFP